MLEVFADRERARFGAWYEFFPRSARRDGKTHGTFKDAEALAARTSQALGFDVIYLPPIHPIGRTARKGKNNTPHGRARTTWAARGPSARAEGGHKAVHPQLGTLEDFRRFVQGGRERTASRWRSTSPSSARRITPT